MKNKDYNKPLIKYIAYRYFLSLFVFMLIYIGIILVIYKILHSKIWYYDDPWYPVLHYINQHAIWLCAASCLFGWLIISIIFIIMCMRYLRWVVRASEQLVYDQERAVILPNAMRSVQDELNYIRELSRKNDKLAKESIKQKNDLIVYLAHDLKTPLTSVIGYLTLLSQEPDLNIETRSKYTGIALNKAMRLETLINEFFDITRLSLTNMSIEKERINLSMMLEQLASEFSPILREKNLSCETKIEPNIYFECDVDKMERVFDNLFRNAINYSFPDTSIMIEMKRKKCITIHFSNKGKHISKDKLQRLFNPFYRADNARSSKTGGAGLGLAITKEIINLHQGTITASCEEDTIVFEIILPL